MEPVAVVFQNISFLRQGDGDFAFLFIANCNELRMPFGTQGVARATEDTSQNQQRV
jgi:hypothetical protein